MKFKLAPLLLVIALIVPQITFASWWNPISWIQEKTPETVISEPTEIKPKEVLKEKNANIIEPKERIKDNFSPEVSEKSTLGVKNSTSKQNYESEIAILKQEIVSLKNSLSSTQRLYKNLLVSIQSKTDIDTVITSNLIERINKLEKQIDDISNNQNNNVDISNIKSRLDALENQPTAKNYDLQIKAMAERINALMRAQTTGSGGSLYCRYLVDQSTLRDGDPGPTCLSMFNSLDY